MKIQNKKLSEEEFRRERQVVLSQWPTGSEVDLEEAVEFHKNLPPGQVMTRKLEKARLEGESYAITGMGKATLEQQLEIWQYVQEAGEADLLATSVDSFSRVLNFAGAQKGLEDSRKAGKSLLNGLPVVNHGVKGLRRIISAVKVPVGLRYGAIDPRLIDEIGLAGGHTSTAPDGIYSFWNMNSKLPLETILRTHQYVMRLAGYYEEKGVPILLSCQGMYDGGAVPPSLVSAALLTQVLMYAGQGAKHIRLHYHLRGNLVQDLACSRVIQKLAHEYLDCFGYTGVDTFLSVALALLKYPEDIGSAFTIMCMNSLAASLCGAQVNDIRTSAEAVTIPTREDIATSFKCAKLMTSLLKGQKIELDRRAVEIEVEREEREVRQIMDRIIELGDGDIAIGTINAVQAGVLDNPFSTSPAVANRIMGVKDCEGAIRYLDTGNLPFSPDILEFHRQKTSERAARLGHQLSYETVIRDISSISRGHLVDYLSH
jgi:methylaspartate mutase epsilon subunit